MILVIIQPVHIQIYITTYTDNDGVDIKILNQGVISEVLF